MDYLKKYSSRLLLLLLLTILWEWLAHSGLVSDFMLPPLEKIGNSMLRLIFTGELWDHTKASLLRFFLGFFISVVTAIPLGILMARSRFFGETLGTVTELLRPIAPTAWIPLSIVWLGLGLKQQVFIVIIGAFFPILLNTIAGVRSIDPIYIKAALTLGAKEKDTLRRIVLPASIPHIITGLKIGLGIGWMCIVSAELVAVKSGLGSMIMDARTLLNTDVVLVGMIIIGIIGLTLSALLNYLEKRICSWRST